MEIDVKSIETAIIKNVTEELCANEELWTRTKRAMDDRINKLFAETVDNRIAEEINKAFTDGFERPFQKVDHFGRPDGEPTTISKELEQMIGQYWSQSVDKSGKPTTTSSYGAVSRAEWMMMRLVADDFSGNMKQHIVNVAGALKDRLRSELHDTVNKLLSEAFHVKSLQDKTLRETGRACIDPEAGNVGGAS